MITAVDIHCCFGPSGARLRRVALVLKHLLWLYRRLGLPWSHREAFEWGNAAAASAVRLRGSPYPGLGTWEMACGRRDSLAQHLHSCEAAPLLLYKSRPRSHHPTAAGAAAGLMQPRRLQPTGVVEQGL